MAAMACIERVGDNHEIFTVDGTLFFRLMICMTGRTEDNCRRRHQSRSPPLNAIKMANL
jgi:hypothetical protein